MKTYIVTFIDAYDSSFVKTYQAESEEEAYNKAFLDKENDQDICRCVEV